MKNTILILTTVGCLALPVFSHADSPSSTKKTSQNATPVASTKSTKKRAVYYITTETHTGSLIPTVYRSYDGRIDSASSPAVYGSGQLTATGALDVSGALYRLDPSISFGRGR